MYDDWTGFSLQTHHVQALIDQTSCNMIFLSNHKTLHSIRLQHLDITGSMSFADVLRTLRLQHDLLKDFSCKQMAQASLRLFFESEGDLHANTRATEWLKIQGLEFFEEFLWVGMPAAYSASAVEWEGVQDKIGLLAEDVRVSGDDFEPDFDHEMYTWGH